MMNFMFILMLLMAAMMNPWIIPIAFAIWIAVKFFKSEAKEEVRAEKDTTIYL